MKEYYTIYINGEKAVKAGYALQGNHCFKSLPFGQLEVTVDENTIKGSIIQKWVDVSYINHGDVEIAIQALADLGFRGCKCIIAKETEVGCVAKTTELCAMII